MNEASLKNIQRQLEMLPDQLSTALGGWYKASREEGRPLDLSDHMNRALSQEPRAVLQRYLPTQNAIKDVKRSSDFILASSASADSLKGCTQYISQRDQHDTGYRAYIGVACSSDCSCDCHISSRAKVYSVSSFMFGSKLFGLGTSTSSRWSCNNQRCNTSKRRISYTYIFPSWLLLRAITVTISNSRSSGPEFNLRLMNVVDRRNREDMLLGTVDWPSSRLVMELKRQLDTGEASIYDTDSFGTSSVLVCANLGLIIKTVY